MHCAYEEWRLVKIETNVWYRERNKEDKVNCNNDKETVQYFERRLIILNDLPMFSEHTLISKFVLD